MKPKFMLWRQYLIETEFWKSDKVVNEIVLGDRDGNIFSLQTDSVTWDRKSTGLTNLVGMSILCSGLIVCADNTSVYVIGRSCEEGNILRKVCKFDLSQDGYEINSLVCVNDSIYVTNGAGNLKIIASKK